MELIIKKFKELTADEIYQIFKLRFEIFVIEQKCIYRDFDDVDKHATHIFYKTENKIIAYTRAYMRKEKIASFGRVCVKEEFRKTGIGKKIVEETIIYINNNFSFDKIYIEAQEYLKKFYGSFGFIQTSEMYLDDGIPHVDMELEKPK